MKTLAIIGRGRNWQDGLKDPNTEKWIVSSAYFSKTGTQADKVFQLHKPEIWEPGCKDIKAKLVIAWDKEGFEGCDKLPVDGICSIFGNVFHSSIAWMLGVAYWDGYRRIELHGIDMLTGTEYANQRDGLFYLMGVLTGLGVEIIVPKTSGMYLKPTKYGVPQ